MNPLMHHGRASGPYSDAPMPQLQLLSNGRYHVMLTSAGGGSSRWKDLAVTRWRENATCDPYAQFETMQSFSFTVCYEHYCTEC